MQSDEDAPCDICRIKYYEPSNKMVFCDGCNVCVHQACYGITEIPSGDWFCNPCQEKIRPKCLFCPSKEGAMKKAENLGWAHVSCVIWIPEVRFSKPDTKDNIVDIEKIPKRRWKLDCFLCHKKGGACIECLVSRCFYTYHVTCAFEHNLHMEWVPEEDSEYGIKLETFCMQHTQMLANGLNPYKDTGLSKKRKKVPDKHTVRQPDSDLENEGYKIFRRFIQTEAPLKTNAASTSNDYIIPGLSNSKEIIANINKSRLNKEEVIKYFPELFTRENIGGADGFENQFTEPTIKKNGNRAQTVEVDNKSVPGIETRQNLPNPFKITARKSFPVPPKRLISQQNSISKKAPKTSQQSDPSNPKKTRKYTHTFKDQARSNIIHALLQSASSSASHNEQAGQASSSISHNEQAEQVPSSTSHNEQEQASSSASHIEQAWSYTSHNEQTGDASSPTSHNEQERASSSAGHNERLSSDFQRPQTSDAIPEINLDHFLRFLASLIRPLSVNRALRVQKKIINLVYEEHQVSSEDSDDVSSVSSLDRETLNK